MGFWRSLVKALGEAARFHLIAERMRAVAGVDCNFRVVQLIGGEARQAIAHAGRNEIRITEETVGLLDNDELAWILGHELAHLKLQHAHKRAERADELVGELAERLTEDHRARRSRGQGTFTRGLQTALLGAAGTALLVASSAGESQSNEFEADKLASEFSSEAGFDPKAGARVLKKLYDEQLPKVGLLEAIFSTHPDPKRRIESIQLHDWR